MVDPPPLTMPCANLRQLSCGEKVLVVRGQFQKPQVLVMKARLWATPEVKIETPGFPPERVQTGRTV